MSVFMCWGIWRNICASIKSLKSQKFQLRFREMVKLHYIFHFLYQWEKIDVCTAWRLYTKSSVFMNYLWKICGCFFFEYCWKEKKKKNQTKLLYLLWMFGKEHHPAETHSYDLDGTEHVQKGAILNAIHHNTSLRLCLTADHRPTKRFLFTLLSRCILSKILIKTKAFSRFAFLFGHVAAVV